MSDPYFPQPIITAATTAHAKFFPWGPYISIILAQWADESGYGAHVSGHYNFFGIKATADQIAAGNATRVLTKEFINGRYITEAQYFANYPTILDGFMAHSQLLTHPWYAKCQWASTPNAYADALHECGYATEPNYAFILKSIIREYNLTQYDRQGV